MSAKPSNSRPHHIDLSKGSLPILTAIALLMACVIASYSVGGFVTSLTSQRDKDHEKFQNIDKELTVIRNLIENGDFIRKSSFELWCRNAEVLNRGFKCGNTK